MREFMEPCHDYIYIKEVKHEEVHASGIILPDVDDPTGNVRTSGRWRVIEVGPGPWTDRVNPVTGEFMRRPMTAKKGDVIYFQGRGFQGKLNGEPLIIIQDYQILGVIKESLVQPVAIAS